MIMANVLKSRKSVRDFKNKKVSLDTLEKVESSIKELEENIKLGNIKFKLYENGSHIYNDLKGLGGYAGVMIESPHYIALELDNRKDTTISYSAYNMEKLVTKLNTLGLDSCWVSLVDLDDSKKKQIFGESTKLIDYILAFGYSKPRNPFVQEPFSERIGVEDLVFDKELGRKADYDDLESRGLGDIFFYIRFAPSTRNEQPWRFIVFDDKIQLLLASEDGEEPQYVDAGIAMYYFEALINTLGINNKWERLNKTQTFEGVNYKYIAEYPL